MNTQSLIHITREFETIKKILDSRTLKIFYCKEDFYMGNRKVSSAAHPMACFSEYTEDINSKTITYGRYGIVFSSNWVARHKIHPVLYINNDSSVADSLGILLKARRNTESSRLQRNLRISIMTIKCFTKNKVGYNSNLEIDDFDFKSECEWRYVPTKEKLGKGLISISRSKYVKDPESYNNKLAKYSLKFNYGSIKAVYVKSKLEIDVLQSEFGLNKGKIKLSKWKTKYED